MLAVAYYRFSSSNQHEESIEAQQEAIQAYAEQNGITIMREYIDRAETATSDDRPEFQKMTMDILDGSVNVEMLLVHKTNRFARNRYDAVVYKHKMAQKGVRVVAITQILSDGPESVIMEALYEAMDEYYSKNLSIEVRTKMKKHAEKAKHLGGIPPLGFDLDKETRQYIINDKEAEAVKLIYGMFLDGKGYGQIIIELNEKGYKTKTGKAFGKNSIYEILRNEKYAGVYVFNKSSHAFKGPRNTHKKRPEEEMVRIPGAMPAIVSTEEWEKVQEKMEGRKNGPRRRGDVLYILTGKIECGECGGSYVGSNAVAGRNKTRYYFYTCGTKRRNKTCKNKDIRKEIIENLVLDKIASFLDPQNIEPMVDKLEAYHKSQMEGIDQEVEQLQEAIRDTETRLKRLLDGIETGTMDIAFAGPRVNELGREKAGLEATLMAVKARKDSNIDRAKIKAFFSLNQQAIADRSDEEACKKLIDLFVKKVIVTEENIEVVLNFGIVSDNDGGGGAQLTLSEINNRRQTLMEQRVNRCPDHRYKP